MRASTSKYLVFALVLAILAPAGPTLAYYSTIAALHNGLTPPNPVTVSGQIISINPVQISDGSGTKTVSGTITVLGLAADTSAYVTVRGNWDGSALTVTDTVAYETTTASSGEERQFLLPSGATTTMCYVPAGSFLMGNSGVGDDATYGYGDESPQHTVYLNGYYVGKNAVTRGEYQAFINAGGYSNPAYWSIDGWYWNVGNNPGQPQYWDASQNWGGATFTQTDSFPVVGVTYYEAEAYCKWAGGYLPSEAEWEMGARWDGHPRIYPWGDAPYDENCNDWYDTNLAGGGYQAYQTAPVGSYPLGVSPYGCLDMAGNVWEWCQDWYKSYPGNASPFDYTGSYRTLRGGGWSDAGYDCRSARRNSGSPDIYGNDCGFRLAR